MMTARIGRLLGVLLIAGLPTGALAQETPGDGAQTDVAPPQPTATDATAAPTAAETDRFVLNNLSPLTVDGLTGFRDRPLFTPSRMPPAPPVVEVPVEPEPEPEPEPVAEPAPEVTTPNVRLAGVLDTSGAAIALIQDLASGITKPYRAGESVEDWSVDAIEPTRVQLSYQGRTWDLRLFQPGTAAPDVSGAELEGAGDAASGSAEPTDPSAGDEQMIRRNNAAIGGSRPPRPVYDPYQAGGNNRMNNGAGDDSGQSSDGTGVLDDPSADATPDPSDGFGSNGSAADFGEGFDPNVDVQTPPPTEDPIPDTGAENNQGNNGFPIDEPQ